MKTGAVNMEKDNMNNDTKSDQSLNKVLKMLGLEESQVKVSIDKDGIAYVEIGKLNVERFIKKVFEVFPEEFNEEK
jgi:hypothetical protein